jgi:predicted acetyltransferase
MNVEIRTISEDELPAYIRALDLAFSGVTSDETIERESALAEPDRCFAAFEGPDIVGTTGVFTMPITVPGGELEVGFVTAVGVRPTHRRRGINTQLMRRQLDDAHERGELVDVLFAQEGGIYGRYGFGLATFGLAIEIESARSAFVRGYEPAGRLRLSDRTEALPEVLALYETARLAMPGMVRLDEKRFHYWLLHEDEDREIPHLVVVHEGVDGADGYAIYRLKSESALGLPGSVLTVYDLQATTAGAYADLWRYIFDVDLIYRVEAWNRPLDEPLLHLLQEPRRLGARIVDNLWVRLVDLAGALRARRYASDGRVVLEVIDRFGPWNEGRFALEVSAGEAAVTEHTDEPADLVCTVNEVGAAYLGGTTFRHLHRAGRVEERTPGALARADAVFGWDPAPWSPFEF